ncbi:hypothetical protein [Limnoglobus roseus]|uniref:Uncharacterized protein n=1 Tax=Limnoglobus roseus TaxID=2598579 RepID=A0A5C1ALC0_9BACT|nr:hypothetical protein [Limnoglobus roseus]QEL18766.1 hypothetical protein PX52LOC_05804 [Limnoglobus roseus]
MRDNDPIGRFAPKTSGEPETLDGGEAFVSLGKCGIICPKGAKALDIERAGNPVVSFQYVYLSVRSVFTPTEFKVVFVGMESWAVTVVGRNLRRLFDRLNDHCLRKLVQTDRDFGDDKDPVVTKIEVENVTPKEKG